MRNVLLAIGLLVGMLQAQPGYNVYDSIQAGHTNIIDAINTPRILYYNNYTADSSRVYYYNQVTMLFTIPYIINSQRLCVRREWAVVDGWYSYFATLYGDSARPDTANFSLFWVVASNSFTVALVHYSFYGHNTAVTQNYEASVMSRNRTYKASVVMHRGGAGVDILGRVVSDKAAGIYVSR